MFKRTVSAPQGSPVAPWMGQPHPDSNKTLICIFFSQIKFFQLRLYGESDAIQGILALFTQTKYSALRDAYDATRDALYLLLFVAFLFFCF